MMNENGGDSKHGSVEVDVDGARVGCLADYCKAFILVNRSR